MAVELGLDYLRDPVLIGQGGFSVVYAAFDERFDRRVAVKVLGQLRNESDRGRFERECRVMGRLSSHPNVVTMYDAGYTTLNQPYLLMELVEGGTLADRLEAGPIPWPEAIDYVIPVADALIHSHGQGILHRDIKPENILLDGSLPKLADFGIAQLRDGAGATSTNVTASWLHTPPETFGNHRDERSDIYSLVSTMYSLIVGTAPFWAATDESINPLMYRMLNEPPPPLTPALGPPALNEVLARGLAKDPAQRQQSAAQLIDELRAVRAMGPGPQPATSVAPNLAASIPSVVDRAPSPAAAADGATSFFHGGQSQAPALPSPALPSPAPQAPALPSPAPQAPAPHVVATAEQMAAPQFTANGPAGSVAHPTNHGDAATVPGPGGADRMKMLAAIGVVAVVAVGVVAWLFTRDDGAPGPDEAVGATQAAASDNPDGADAAGALTDAAVNEIPLRTPIRATVDGGSMVEIDRTDPVIGTDGEPPSLEVVPARTLVGRLSAFIDRNPTSVAQFYDFATFRSAVAGGDPAATWAQLVPTQWLAAGTGVPTMLSELGLDERAPVAGLSWAAANEYCTYALKRMPTEIEWEVAAVDGLIEASGAPIWVAEPETYGAIPVGSRVGRGASSPDRTLYVRTIVSGDGDGGDAAEAGLRCAVDEAVEVAKPSGQLLYTREFSGADDAREWPDLHDPALPETVFGYHAPDVFHIEVGAPRLVAVLSGSEHSDDVEISGSVELRVPANADDFRYRYGILVNASDAGALYFVVHPGVDGSGGLELQWCVHRGSGSVISADNYRVIPNPSPDCERQGAVPTGGFRNTLTVRLSEGDAEFFIDDVKVDTMFHGLPPGGTFGFVSEAFDGDPLSHIHFDNLVIKSN